MTVKQNAGGPAFPSDVIRGNSVVAQHRGMDLRDWFAGMAIADIVKQSTISLGDGEVWIPADQMARVAYDMADAMLAAREKP